MILNRKDVKNFPRRWAQVLRDTHIVPIEMKMAKDPDFLLVIFYRWDMEEVIPGERLPRFKLVFQKDELSNGRYRIQRTSRPSRTLVH